MTAKESELYEFMLVVLLNDFLGADTDKMLTETSSMESKRRTKPNTDGKPPTRFNPNAVRLRSKQEDSYLHLALSTTAIFHQISTTRHCLGLGRGEHKSTHKIKNVALPRTHGRTTINARATDVVVRVRSRGGVTGSPPRRASRRRRARRAG